MDKAVQEFILEMKLGKHDKLLQEILTARHKLFTRKAVNADNRTDRRPV